MRAVTHGEAMQMPRRHSSATSAPAVEFQFGHGAPVTGCVLWLGGTRSIILQKVHQYLLQLTGAAVGPTGRSALPVHLEARARAFAHPVNGTLDDLVEIHGRARLRVHCREAPEPAHNVSSRMASAWWPAAAISVSS
ncbi:MAG TPA: hypothetical protein VLA61_02995 [Ideonella sp.]|uniref:hypothetical protein n=1 Tax=Ideonella sp. TaxID=1929293 RepID=UPI002D003715|nr:hypothetical protein [Ideonella sp.]HSI47211.1 hypothetical protein [Ideonella sp.]